MKVIGELMLVKLTFSVCVGASADALRAESESQVASGILRPGGRRGISQQFRWLFFDTTGP